MQAVERNQIIGFEDKDRVVAESSSERNIVYLSDDSPSGICTCRIECPGHCACASK